MKKTVLVFGALIIALLTLFQISTYSITYGNITIELVIGGIAVLSFLFGMFWNRRNRRREVPKSNSSIINQANIIAAGITEREYEILVKISEGHSNKEIGEQLFISESTVKTHVSNLFSKLDAKRRTQAIQKAKEIQIIG